MSAGRSTTKRTTANRQETMKSERRIKLCLVLFSILSKLSSLNFSIRCASHGFVSRRPPKKKNPLEPSLWKMPFDYLPLSSRSVRVGWSQTSVPSPRSRAAGAPRSHTPWLSQPRASPSPATLCLAHIPRSLHPTLDYILSPVSLSFGVLRTSICYSLSHSVFSILHICVLACINFVFYSYFYLFTFYTSPCTSLYKKIHIY